jgi:hypothetical protein
MGLFFSGSKRPPEKVMSRLPLAKDLRPSDFDAGSEWNELRDLPSGAQANLGSRGYQGLE